MTNQMTGVEFCRIRRSLNYTQYQLGELWGMGPNGGRTIGRWETGQCAIPGAAAVAIRAMEAGFVPESEPLEEDPNA